MSDRNKILIAIAVSLLLHLLGFFGIATWTLIHPDTPVTPPVRKQIEVTLLQAPTPPKIPLKAAALPSPPPVIQEKRRTLDTEGLTAVEKPPENAEFESDKNSRAASELAASGNESLPSQQGRTDLKFTDFKMQNHSEGKSKQEPAPSPQPSTPPKAESKPIQAVPTPAPEKKETPPPTKVPDIDPDGGLAMQKPTPVGKPQPPQPTPQPAQPKELPRLKTDSGYQPQKEQRKIAGNISNRGKAGVNALGTPLGRYQKFIADAVGSRWQYYIGKQMDLITVGEARIKFCVNTNGRVETIQILSNTSNQMFGIYCMNSIKNAELPPIPPEIAALLENGKLEIEFSFTIYPNQ